MVLGAGTYGDHRLQVKLRVVLSGRSAACTGAERGAEGRCQYKAVHSQYKYVDQSMENWQVSGGGEYWFRCIPSRLGCIATFLISKAPRSCVAICMRRLAVAGAAASSASSASVASAALHASSTLRDGEHAYQQFSSQLTTARRVGRAGGASRPHARYALGALGNR